MIQEIVYFLQGSVGYFFLYLATAILGFLSFCYWLSAALTHLDKSKYDKRVEQVSENKDEITYLENICANDTDSNSIINEIKSQKQEKLKQLAHLKSISDEQIKIYLKKAIFYTLWFIIVFGLSFGYEKHDILTHLNVAQSQSYENSNIKTTIVDNTKTIKYLDKEKSIEYTYYFDTSQEQERLKYAEKNIQIPAALKTFFKALYWIFNMFIIYIARIMLIK